MARQVEEAGYDTLLLSDHPANDDLAPVPALVSAADATTRLRVGTMVFDNDLRNPVMLAKEAFTLDLLTEGRFELGIGAGWSHEDDDQTGIPLTYRHQSKPVRGSSIHHQGFLFG